MKKIFNILLGLMFILLAVSVIFFFSDQGSGQSHSLSLSLSSAIVSNWIKQFDLSYLTPEKQRTLITALDGPLRKLAHLFIYMVLGFVIYTFIWLIRGRRTSFRHVFAVLILVFIVASIDEINQHFSQERGASFQDVILDTIGGACGVYLLFLIRDFKRHLKNGIQIHRQHRKPSSTLSGQDSEEH